MKNEKLKISERFDAQRLRILAGYLFMCFSLFTLLFSLAGEALGQEETTESAPPPLKIISKDEISRLVAKTDPKDRTKVSLEMMNLRLTTAEKTASMRDFDGMYRELGFFHALMDDALTFLHERDNGNGKILDSFKRLEIALRGMATRIEVIRRELPLKYDPYVRKLTQYLRTARARATDSLFDDSVLPGKKPAG